MPEILLPVNEKDQSRSPGTYLTYLRKILSKIEDHNVKKKDAVGLPQNEVTKAYFYNVLSVIQKNLGAMELGRKKKAFIVRKVVQSINEDKVEFTLPECVDETKVETKLNEEINDVKRRIANSRLYNQEASLSSNQSRPRQEDCFIPKSFSVHHMEKTFTLMPHFKLTKSFMDIDKATLVSLVNQCPKTKAEVKSFLKQKDERSSNLQNVVFDDINYFIMAITFKAAYKLIAIEIEEDK